MVANRAKVLAALRRVPRRSWRALPVALALLACHPAAAVQPDEILKNPILEARARALSRELRCMVCQNQSIDDSDAPLARDLRILVRERLTEGDSDPQVVDFLVALWRVRPAQAAVRMAYRGALAHPGRRADCRRACRLCGAAKASKRPVGVSAA
jgi:hypothetical protein